MSPPTTNEPTHHGWLRLCPNGRWQRVVSGASHDEATMKLLLVNPAGAHNERIVLPAGRTPTGQKG